jgi:hypothetical protein
VTAWSDFSKNACTVWKSWLGHANFSADPCCLFATEQQLGRLWTACIPQCMLARAAGSVHKLQCMSAQATGQHADLGACQHSREACMPQRLSAQAAGSAHMQQCMSAQAAGSAHMQQCSHLVTNTVPFHMQQCMLAQAAGQHACPVHVSTSCRTACIPQCMKAQAAGKHECLSGCQHRLQGSMHIAVHIKLQVRFCDVTNCNIGSGGLQWMPAQAARQNTCCMPLMVGSPGKPFSTASTTEVRCRTVGCVACWNQGTDSVEWGQSGLGQQGWFYFGHVHVSTRCAAVKCYCLSC